MIPSSSKAYQARFPLLVLIALLIALHGLLLARPDAHLVHLVPDDACFYPRIAQNVLLGHGVTFDGLGVTTGFHPAWFLALTGVLKAVTLVFPNVLHDGHLLFRISLLATCAVNLLLGLVTYGLLRRATASRWAFLCMALALSMAVRLMGYGLMMETHLLILFLGVLLWAAGHYATAAPPRRLRTGLALAAAGALVPLACIDFSIVAFLVAFLAFAFRGSRSDRTAAGWIVGGAAAGIALNMAFNFAVTGNLFSTSAYLKNYGPPLDMLEQLAVNLGRARAWTGRLDGAAALVLAGTAGWIFRHKDAPGRPGVLRLAFFCAASFSLLFLHLLKNNLPAPWYYWPFRYFLFLGAAAGLLALADRFAAGRPRPGPRWISGLGHLAALLIVLHAGQSLRAGLNDLPMDRGHAAVYGFSKDVAARVPEDGLALCEDFSGFISLFSQRRIVNGDGLVNSPEFISGYLTQGKVWDYLKTRRIGYYVVSRMDTAEFRRKRTEPVFLDAVKPFFLDVPPSVIPLDNRNLLAHRTGARRDRTFALFKLDFDVAVPPESASGAAATVPTAAH